MPLPMRKIRDNIGSSTADDRLAQAVILRISTLYYCKNDGNKAVIIPCFAFIFVKTCKKYEKSTKKTLHQAARFAIIFMLGNAYNGVNRQNG